MRLFVKLVTVEQACEKDVCCVNRRNILQINVDNSGHSRELTKLLSGSVMSTVCTSSSTNKKSVAKMWTQTIARLSNNTTNRSDSSNPDKGGGE